MLITFAPLGIFFLVVGAALILSGSRRRHVESASIGGSLVGVGLMILAFQFFYVIRETDGGVGYYGTPASEALLGMSLAVGLALVIMSLCGWATDKFFWHFFVKPKRT